MNTTFLEACRGKKTSHVPVWFMRQAGRYLPDYQRVRSRRTFLELCKNPELATEVTLQPIDIFGFDAAILFSDILIPMEAMGLPLEFHDGRGPIFPEPVRDQKAAEALRVPDTEADMPFVLETIRLLRRELKVPLIGFAGAPFTLATYVIEGGSSKNFVATKGMMFHEPELYRSILDKITACTSSYLIAQAKAGAQALQLFDSWAGALAPCDYERFALPYVQTILADLRQHTDIPLIYFANNGATLLPYTSTLDADVLGIDWRIPLADAIRRAGPHAVQGNLDPLALFLPKEDLEARIAAMLADASEARGYIFNLGHGVVPETDPDQVKIAVDAVHRFSSQGN
ncbi:MAG: uroporphyrinogen decarboxylase [bacterium]|nr:uroporphyrinogen decarboxylase [bacterium]